MWLWNFSMLTSFELEKCINRWYFNVEYGDKFHVHLYWAQKCLIILGSDFSKQHPATNSVRSLYSPRKGKVRDFKGKFSYFSFKHCLWVLPGFFSDWLTWKKKYPCYDKMGLQAFAPSEDWSIFIFAQFHKNDHYVPFVWHRFHRCHTQTPKTLISLHICEIGSKPSLAACARRQVFLWCSLKLCCGFLLELLWLGISNEYPQHMIWG